MAHTAGPLSCSRNISMEPDRASWTGHRQGRKDKKQKHGGKKGFHKKKTQPTEPSYFITSRHYSASGSRASAVRERCRRLSLFVFSLYFHAVKKKTDAVATMGAFSVDGCHCPAVSSQIQGSSTGRAGIIPPFTAPFLHKT